jgi:hypothetical protein
MFNNSKSNIRTDSGGMVGGQPGGYLQFIPLFHIRIKPSIGLRPGSL